VILDKDAGSTAAKGVLILGLETRKTLSKIVPGLALLATGAGAGEDYHATHGAPAQ
jgi:hypothetical protein